MPTTGFLLPTTDTAVSGSWTTPTNVQADDAADATVAPGKNVTSSRDAGGFGFNAAIPAAAIIDKVEIKEEYFVSVNTSIATVRVNGNVGGTILANHDDATEPLSYLTTTFDITADRAWVRADLLDGTFFIRFSGVQGNSSTAVTFHWDYVAVQVTYHIPLNEEDFAMPQSPPAITNVVIYGGA